MKTLYRRSPPVDPLTSEAVTNIHQQTLDVLSETGVRFEWDQARLALADAGGSVHGEIVKIPPEVVEAHLAKAPASFKLHARRPEYSVVIGDESAVCTPIYGATHIIGRDGRRRAGDLSALSRLHALVQGAEGLQNVGSNILEPADVPVRLRHLLVARSLFVHTDKTFMGISSSRDSAVTAAKMAHVRARDTIAMADIAFGHSARSTPRMIGIATCNRALTWEEASLRALTEFAAAGEAIMIAPFSISGSNAPADSASLLVQVNAEVLAGIVYAQAVREGAPVLYGPYATALDPVSKNSLAGTPDIVLYLLAFGQLARFYRLPYRGGGQLTGSKINDYQAAMESQTMLLSSLLAGSHFLFHTGGWLEGGLTVDVAKLYLDLEELDKLIRTQKGLELQDLCRASERLAEWGHGVNHAVQQASHPPAHAPKFADYLSYEQWEAEGRDTAADRARRHIDANSEIPPLLASDTLAELDAYIDSRKPELLA